MLDLIKAEGIGESLGPPLINWQVQSVGCLCVKVRDQSLASRGRVKNVKSVGVEAIDLRRAGLCSWWGQGRSEL